MASFTISSYKKASIVALVLRQGNGSRHWETIYNKTNIAKVSPFQQESIAFRSFRENTLYVHPFNGNFYRLSEKTKTLTNSIPSGKVASLRSLLGKRWITFPFASSKKFNQTWKKVAKLPQAWNVCTTFLAVRNTAKSNQTTSYHSLSPCLFHKRQNNQQDGTFLEPECHVGNHIHTPSRMDAILDWATRMRCGLDLGRCGMLRKI